MSGQDIMYAIGDIDDRFVERAELRIRRHPSFSARRNKKLIIGAVAACLVLVVIVGIINFSGSLGLDGPVSKDMPSMVYVNSQVYICKYSCAKKPTDIKLLGKIESVTKSNPSEEFQTNDESFVGDEVYQYDKNLIVLDGDTYWVFMPVNYQD